MDTLRETRGFSSRAVIGRWFVDDLEEIYSGTKLTALVANSFSFPGLRGVGRYMFWGIHISLWRSWPRQGSGANIMVHSRFL